MPRAVPDPAFWSGRRVLVTGHTGFKGGWLTLWLEALGAEVSGFSRRDGGDVTDAAAVRAAVAAARPEVVFHLASLATVQLGYEDPAAVYAVNVVGTANLLQAVRDAGGVQAVVGVTVRQVLPRPGRRAALPRGRPARRLRPVLELQGGPGAGDRRVPRLARGCPSPARGPAT
jgi:nucleoside-diphosphate-sugar epimerase